MFFTLSICRRWFEHLLPSSSLPLTFIRPFDNSEPELTECFTTPTQSSLQLGLFLNDLRGIPPVIEGLVCLCRYRHPVTAVSLPDLRDTLSTSQPVFRPLIQKLPAAELRNQVRAVRQLHRYGDLVDDLLHGLSMS